MITFIYNLCCFAAVVAAVVAIAYVISIIENLFRTYIWEDRLENIWPFIQRVFGWIFTAFLLLCVIMLFANSCHAQEEYSKEASKRWAARLDSVDKAWKQADIQKEQGTYVPPVSKSKWIPKDQWIAKKRKEDSIALYNKVYRMTDAQYSSFADSVAQYRVNKLNTWKQNNPDYQYKKFQRDSLRTWRKDSTSQYWVEYKEQSNRNYKAIQEVMKEERDSTSKYWERKKATNYRVKENKSEAIERNREEQKKAKEVENAKKAEYIERHTGRNQYLSDEQYNKEKAKKKN